MNRPVIKCKCCRQRGPHGGYGWINACYRRWLRAGRPADGPPPEKTKRGAWIPERPGTLAVVVRFARLATAGASTARIRWELDLSERQYQRYAAAWRNIQALADREAA